MAEILDITAPFSQHLPVWPGVAPTEIFPASSIAKGDMGNTLRINTINHVGTHMDAPRHFLEEGATLDELPLELVCGRAKVIWVDNQYEIPVEALEKAGIEGEERILIKSRMSWGEWWEKPFIPDFPHLSDAAAIYLVDAGVKLVGIDYISISGYNKNEVSIHTTLLGSGVWIVEGLLLQNVEPGHYELYCLPLKIKAGDGAPCRAILKTLS